MAELDTALRDVLTGKTEDDSIEQLRNALTNPDNLREPWTSGVITLSEPERTLFYKRQDGTSTSLELGSTTVAQAEDLGNACEPATSGLDDKDVLDETYRKAGQLDAGNFAWLFSPSDHGDFANKLVSGLLPWKAPDRGIRFELCKLNVYGEGSFFKGHHDAPRSEDMFGFLVVLFPFTHEGGSMLFRHRKREFIFDGQALLQDAPSTASAAYVAFFGDVEQEVARVVSGHCVTVTFNLYFDANKGPLVTQIPADLQPEHPFKTALKTIINDPVLQLAHPFLGFGLQHPYHSESAISSSVDLKGTDAILVETLNELDIKNHFFLLYREDRDNKYCPFRVLTMDPVDGEADNMTSELDLVAGDRSFLVWDRDPREVAKRPPMDSAWYECYEEDKEQYKRMDVEWVTKPRKKFLNRTATFVYGDGPEYHYHQLCVVAILLPKELSGEVKKDTSEDFEGDAIDEDGNNEGLDGDEDN